MGEEKDDIYRTRALLWLAGYKLTQRQTEIFLLLAKGKKNKEIAAILFIDYDTVRTHRARIFKACKVNSKHGVTEIARGLGMV